MPLGPNARNRYIREQFENILPGFGLKGVEVRTYIDDTLKHISDRAIAVDGLFDIRKIARIHNKQELIGDEKKALALVLKDPKIALEINDILKQEKPEQKPDEEPKRGRPFTADKKRIKEEGLIPQERVAKRKGSLELPDNETITKCAVAFKEIYGHTPNAGSSGEKARAGGLPATSPAWSGIAIRINEERGTTISKLIREHELKNKPQAPAKETEPETQKQLDATAKQTRKRGSGPSPLPDNDTIARCAKAYVALHGHQPTMASTGDLARAGGLPEELPAWTSIIKRLPEERGTTIRKLIKAYDAKTCAANADPAAPATAVPASEKISHKFARVSAPLPDNDTIARCAKAYKDTYGTLPKMSSTKERARAGGLPAEGPPWTTIILKLPEQRKTNLSTLVAALEKKELEESIAKLPERTAVTVFNAAVQTLHTTGKIELEEGLDDLFKHKRVTGLENLVGKDVVANINTAADFLVATGLATKGRGHQLNPAPRPVIAQFARLIAE